MRMWMNKMRNHKRRGCRKLWVFLILMPLLILLRVCCQRRRALKKARKMVEIENRLYRSKYGCEWSVNECFTEISLKRCQRPEQQVQMQAYPVQPVHAVYPVQYRQTPFEGYAAPLFTERSDEPVHQQTVHHRGYARVSLDDSSIEHK
jgi:hypothetical protein